MHSPESLNNNSAKENEERREEQGQQGHHFSPEGRFANSNQLCELHGFCLNFSCCLPQSTPCSFPRNLVYVQGS